jgi:hypothetical protein
MNLAPSPVAVQAKIHDEVPLLGPPAEFFGRFLRAGCSSSSGSIFDSRSRSTRDLIAGIVISSEFSFMGEVQCQLV